MRTIGVRSGKPSPFHPSPLPTIGGLGALGDVHSGSGVAIVQVLQRAYEEMYGQPHPSTSIQWWLNWAATITTSKQWRALMAKHEDYHWGIGINPSIWYGIWNALARYAGDILQGMQQYPQLANERAYVMPMRVGTDLTADQWTQISRRYVTWAAEKVAKGLLTLNHLDAIVDGFATDDPASRKFTLIQPAPTLRDDEITSFYAYLRGIGYFDQTRGYLDARGRTYKDRAQQMDAAIDALNVADATVRWTSGKAVLDKMNEMIEQYFTARDRYVPFNRKFRADMATGLVTLSPEQRALYDTQLQKLADIDRTANQVVSKLGASWPGDTGPGSLGFHPLVLAGVGAVALGVISLFAYLYAQSLAIQRKQYEIAQSAYRSVQNSLDAVERQIEAQYQVKMNAVETNLSQGRITESEANTQRLSIERWKQAELEKVADKRADVNIEVPNLGGGGGIGGTLLGIGAIGIAGFLWWRMRG